MAYLIHHTLNRNGIYTGGKPDTVPFDEKSLTNGRKCDFEYPIHGRINGGKIEGAYFARVPSIF